MDQLNPKGLALLMGLFAEKEKNENQPVIAGDKESLKHVAKLIDDSPVGTEIAVIFQEADSGKNHKTAFKLVKNDSGIDVIHMDSIANPSYIERPNDLINAALRENAKDQGREPTPLVSFEPTFKIKDIETGDLGEEVIKYFNTQNDSYQCGTFACKYARMFAKGEHQELCKNLSNAEDAGGNVRKFVIPQEFLKSVQSSTYRRDIADNYDMNVTVNPRTGKTLQDIYDKYAKPSDYASHFSKKYLGMVAEFLQQNKAKPTAVKDMANKYDAGKLGMDDIVRINKGRDPTYKSSSLKTPSR